MLSYQQDENIYCLLSTHEGADSISTMIRLVPESGASAEICGVDGPSMFSGFGSGIFVTATGAVISLSSGVTLRQLSFAD